MSVHCNCQNVFMNTKLLSFVNFVYFFYLNNKLNIFICINVYTKNHLVSI